MKFMEKYEVGKIIKGKVTGIENYGIFLNIDNKYTGLIHISEISEQYVKNVQDYVNLNEKIKARIIGIDVKNNQLKLSIKDVKNYRYSKKNNNGIIETPKGFSTIEEKLPLWIEEKYRTLEKK